MGTKLYVGNLSFNTTENELQELRIKPRHNTAIGVPSDFAIPAAMPNLGPLPPGALSRGLLNISPERDTAPLSGHFGRPGLSRIV